MTTDTRTKRFLSWIDFRFPLTEVFERLSKYPAPTNLNIWYLFGFLLIVVLAMQIVTGLWLMMNYTNSAEEAFLLLNTS